MVNGERSKPPVYCSQAAVVWSGEGGGVIQIGEDDLFMVLLDCLNIYIYKIKKNM